MKTIFGGLIEFETQSKLIEFLESIDNSGSINIIETSIEYGLKSGLYSLDEAYCLFMCLTKLKENDKVLNGKI